MLSGSDELGFSPHFCYNNFTVKKKKYFSSSKTLHLIIFLTLLNLNSWFETRFLLVFMLKKCCPNYPVVNIEN